MDTCKTGFTKVSPTAMAMAIGWCLVRAFGTQDLPTTNPIMVPPGGPYRGHGHMDSTEAPKT